MGWWFGGFVCIFWCWAGTLVVPTVYRFIELIVGQDLVSVRTISWSLALNGFVSCPHVYGFPPSACICLTFIRRFSCYRCVWSVHTRRSCHIVTLLLFQYFKCPNTSKKKLWWPCHWEPGEVKVMGGCTARFVYVFLYNICILFVNLVVWCETIPF